MVRGIISAVNAAIAKYKTLGLNPDGWLPFLSGEAHRGVDELIGFCGTSLIPMDLLAFIALTRQFFAIRTR